MAFWLFKSEPSAWSWKQQWEKRPQSEEWSGVRNYQARNFMRKMALGDLAFFYHSVAEKQIVGIVEITSLAHPDSTEVLSPSSLNRWDCVDITAVAPVPRPVTLAQVKAEPSLAQMSLVTSMRLSVQPVRPEEWQKICEMAGYIAEGS